MTKKKLTLAMFCLFSMLFTLSCETNKKLNQNNAAKAIRQFLSTNSPRGYFGVEAISSIEPVSQFSDNEASSVVRFNWPDGSAVLRFKFQTNVDRKWILTSLEEVEVHTQGLAEWVHRNRTLNIVAQ